VKCIGGAVGHMRWIVMNVVLAVECTSITLHIFSGRQMCSRGVWFVLVWGISAVGMCLAVYVGECVV